MQPGPCSREITTPTPHHSIVTGPTTSVKALKAKNIEVQCFDAVGWAAGRASGL